MLADAQGRRAGDAVRRGRPASHRADRHRAGPRPHPGAARRRLGRDRAAAAARPPPPRSTRATRPTSSTPRAPPEHPRAWWWRRAALSNFLGAMPQTGVTAAAADRAAGGHHHRLRHCRALELYLPLTERRRRRAGAARGGAGAPQRWRARSPQAAPPSCRLTPTLWQSLLNDGGAGIELSGLAHAVVGGEALPGELGLRAAGSGRCQLLADLYGPTETTIWVGRHDACRRRGRAHPADRPSDLEHAGLCFGFLDWSLCRLGLRASFTLRGLGLARGYLGRRRA